MMVPFNDAETAIVVCGLLCCITGFIGGWFCGHVTSRPSPKDSHNG